ETDLHQLRQRIQPRDAVVDLEDRVAARFEDPPAFLDELPRIGGVLHDAVGEHQIERAIGKRQVLAVGDFEPPAKTLLLEVRAGERNRRRREVDAGYRRAGFREAREVDTRAAGDPEARVAAARPEQDEADQVMKLRAMTLI